MNAFLTGSQVYGTPTAQSDVDLAVRVSDSDCELLATLADQEPGSGGMSIRFGNLNLICLGERSFEAWREATEELIARKPVTRDEAVKVIKAKLTALRDKAAAA